jgi:hypothetical protein
MPPLLDELAAGDDGHMLAIDLNQGVGAKQAGVTLESLSIAQLPPRGLAPFTAPAGRKNQIAELAGIADRGQWMTLGVCGDSSNVQGLRTHALNGLDTG